MMIKPLSLDDYPMAIGLIDLVFGPGRYAKTSEIWRQSAKWLPRLSHMATHEDQMVGVVLISQCEGEEGLVFLGPIAVLPHFRSQGLGCHLVETTRNACREAGFQRLYLIGSIDYFEPQGFQIDQELAKIMRRKGPSFDAKRLLSCSL